MKKINGFYGGTMEHSNGTEYLFKESNCSLAMTISTRGGEFIAAIPKEGSQFEDLKQEDFDLAEFVIDSMTLTAEFLANSESRKSDFDKSVEATIARGEGVIKDRHRAIEPPTQSWIK